MQREKRAVFGSALHGHGEDEGQGNFDTNVEVLIFSSHPSVSYTTHPLGVHDSQGWGWRCHGTLLTFGQMTLPRI